MGSREYLERWPADGAWPADDGPVRRRSSRGTASRGWSSSWPGGCGARRAAPRVRARVIFTAHSLPERMRGGRRHLPRAAGRVGPPGRPRRPGSTSGRWPGRARAAPPSRGSVPTCATRCAGSPPRARPTPSWCARSASWPTTSRCSTTSTSSWRAVAAAVRPRLRAARRRSTTIPLFVAVAGRVVIVGADGGPT